MNEPLFMLDATSALSLIRQGEVKISDLVQSCLGRIEQIEPSVAAWAYIDFEKILLQAEALNLAMQSKLAEKPLFGIPVGIKDIFNTYDMPTQMGSPIWNGFTPGNDARVVHYLHMAQAVVFGKTVTAEFAVHTPGPTRNPHHPEYMAGTSSTGSAVAVAAQMVPLALGTQTAGSIIRPASYNGIYGYKPSFGLVPRTGVLKTTDSLDTVGIFARSARDLRLLFDVIRVKGVDYPLHEKYLLDEGRQTPTGSWRVGVVRGPKWDYVESYAQEQLFAYADALGQEESISVKAVKLPGSFTAVHDLHSILYDRSLAYYFKEEYKQKTLISKLMYEIIAHGNQITLDQYRDALEQQSKIANELDRFLVEEQIDILLDISTGGEPLKGLDAVDRPDHCLIWTFCRVPAMNLPVFIGPNRLPYGAQIVTRRYSDYKLLSFAQHLCDVGLSPSSTNPPLAH